MGPCSVIGEALPFIYRVITTLLATLSVRSAVNNSSVSGPERLEEVTGPLRTSVSSSGRRGPRSTPRKVAGEELAHQGCRGPAPPAGSPAEAPGRRFLTTLEGRRLRSRCQRWGSPRGLPPWLAGGRLLLPVSSRGLLSGGVCIPIPSSRKDPSHGGLGPGQRPSFDLRYLFKDAVHNHVLRSWRLGLNMALLGGTVLPVSGV